MSTTRQTRSKKGKAAAAADSSAENLHQPPTSLSIPTLPDDIDIDVLQGIISPEMGDLHAPSVEFVLTLYRIVHEQSGIEQRLEGDLDETKAELERKDVELDQALQDKEVLANEHEKVAESLHKQVDLLKKERDELDEAKNSLSERLASLSSSTSTSSAELDSSRQQISDLEREKRDLLNVITRLNEEGSQREEEIQTLRTNLKEARQEHQQLETQVRELRSNDTSTKFTIDNLRHQLKQAQTASTEANLALDTKLSEFATYRRSKSSELSSLQSTHDALLTSHTSLQSTSKALQSTHTKLQHQLEQSLSKVQDLQGKLAEQQVFYEAEAMSSRALIEKLEERDEKNRRIVEGIESQWEGVGEKAHMREEALRREVEREKERREEGEERIEQLEGVLERIGRGDLPVPRQGEAGDSISAVSGFSSSASFSSQADGLAALSPTVAMASRAQRGGRTFTEVYADYVKLQDEYARKCAEYSNMDRTLTRILAEIEERAPVLAQQRDEYARVQVEASHLTTQLSAVISERDMHASYSKDASSKLAASTKENKELNKNLADLGAQIQHLIRHISRLEDPTLPPLSEDELAALDAPQSQGEGAESIDGVITNSLVLFRSIPTLQSQNAKLLTVVRQLGEKLENEEREYKAVLEAEQEEAVMEAHEAMEGMKSHMERQKRAWEESVKAYVAERDALRVRLVRAEERLGAPLNGDVDGDDDMMGVVVRRGGREDEELREHYETYKSEMEIDTGKLRVQLGDAQREMHRLSADLAKANAKIEYLTDRNRMTTEQTENTLADLRALSARNEQSLTANARLETELERSIDDLQSSTIALERLRNEAANLRAERKIYEDNVQRLTEDNRRIQMEKNQLGDLVGSMQRMNGDLESAVESDRRRVERQLGVVEAQNQDLRTQLSQDREALRHVSLQKEIEQKDMQKRIDKLTAAFSQTRETLVGAETSNKHLEERVDDLSKQKQAAEEKLSVYERRPAGMTSPPPPGQTTGGGERELQTEVADLRAALKVSEMDLAAARRNVEQFQSISTANEDALASLHRTHDDYKMTTDAQITYLQSKIESLTQKVQDTKEETDKLVEKHAELQKVYEEDKRAWGRDKAELVATITELGMAGENSEGDRATHERELKAQQERTLAAESKYSNEIIAHAESMKKAEALKSQLSQANAQNRELTVKAETATAALTDSQVSWEAQKEALEKKSTDLTTQCKELSDQNAILHKHLETVTKQAARIKQTAASSAEAAASDEGDAESTDVKISELRAVVAFLRKEKEIVDLQLELSKQESARFKAQVDRLTHSLEESRQALAAERERGANTAAADARHQELVERINQLNLLRESNITLRAECEAQMKKSRQLEASLYDLNTQLEPIKEEARVAKAEVQAREEQVRGLEEESRRWQERNQQLLSKYDRIDPADMQALKEQIEQLQKTVQELQAGNEEKDALLKEAEVKADSERNAALSKFNTNMERAKTVIAKWKGMNAEKQTELDAMQVSLSEITNERDQLLQIKASLEAEKNAMEAEKTVLEQQVKSAADAVSVVVSADQGAAMVELTSERGKLVEERNKLLEENAKLSEEKIKLLEAQQQASTDAPASTDDAPAGWEAEKAELVKARDLALQEAKTAVGSVQKSISDLKDVKTSHDRLQQQLRTQMQARQQEQLKAAEQLREAKEATEAAEAKAKEVLAQPSASTQPADELASRHAEELKALEQRLVAEYEQKLKDTAAAAASQPAASTEPSEDQAKIIADAVEKGVAQGRKEIEMKMQLKDKSLVTARTRMKDLEAKVLELERQVEGSKTGGAKPPAVAPTQPGSSAGDSAAGGAEGAEVNAAPTSGQKPAPGTAANKAKAGLPTKPAGAGAAANRAGRAGAPAGANTAKGGATQQRRPAAPAAAALAAAAQSTSAATSGLTIAGAAAGKRPREAEAATTEDGQAKRLKPTPEPGAKPVQLRRPPAQT